MEDRLEQAGIHVRAVEDVQVVAVLQAAILVRELGQKSVLHCRCELLPAIRLVERLGAVAATRVAVDAHEDVGAPGVGVRRRAAEVLIDLGREPRRVEDGLGLVGHDERVLRLDATAGDGVVVLIAGVQIDLLRERVGGYEPQGERPGKHEHGASKGAHDHLPPVCGIAAYQPSPLRASANAIQRPSGDTTGVTSATPALCVRRVSTRVERSIVNSSDDVIR